MDHKIQDDIHIRIAAGVWAKAAEVDRENIKTLQDIF
jgi:hypothetical protein